MAMIPATDDSPLTPDVDVTTSATPVSPSGAQPDLSKTASAMQSVRARSANLTVLTVLAVLYTLFFARDFLLPIVFALLLSFLFSPVVRALAQIHVPAPLGAGLIIVVILSVIGSGAFGLSGSIRDWAATAPQTLAIAEAKLGRLVRRMLRLRIKPPLSAALIVLLLVTAFSEAAYQLTGPAQRWALSAPQSFARAQGKLRSIIRPVQQVTTNVQKAADAVGAQAEKKSPSVIVQTGPSAARGVNAPSASPSPPKNSPKIARYTRSVGVGIP